MKTKQIGTRMLAVFFALAFLLTLLPITAMPAKADGTTRDYVLATELVDGRQYLISDTKMDPNTDPDTGEVTWPESMNAHIMGWELQGTNTRELASKDVTVTDGHISIDPSDNATYLWKVERNSDNNAFGLLSAGYYVTGNHITDDATYAKYWTYSNNNLRFSGTFTIRYDANSGNFVRFQDNNPTPVYFYEEVYSIKDTSSGYRGSLSFSKSDVPAKTGGLSGIKAGEQVTITANPHTDCRLESLTVNRSTVTVDENNQYTFEYTFGGDIDVSAFFLPIPYYDITIPISSGGSVVAKVNGTTASRAEQNDTVTLDVTANPGYHLHQIYYHISDGVAEDHPITGYSFTMPQGNITIYAEFVKDLPFTPASSIESGGKYLLVTQTTGGTLYALGYNGSAIQKRTVSSIDAFAYVSNPDVLWTVTSSNDSFQIMNNGMRIDIGSDGNTLGLNNGATYWTLTSDHSLLDDHYHMFLIFNENSGAGGAFDTSIIVNPGNSSFLPVYLMKYVPVERLSLDKNELELVAGDSATTLSATVLPADATGKGVTWTSNNTNVATVDADGNVTPVAQGTATVTASSTSDPSVTATCSIKVYPEGTVARIGNTTYSTLVAAFDAAVDGDTINVLKNYNGDGIFVAGGDNAIFTDQGLTVDFGGHTYTISGTLVGSTNTQNQGVHLEMGNKITFRNGHITSTFRDDMIILVQNYSDLTLSNMELGLNRIELNDNDKTLRVNYGVVNITDGSMIRLPYSHTSASGFALYVCPGSAPYGSANVTIDESSNIYGYMGIADQGIVDLLEDHPGMDVTGMCFIENLQLALNCNGDSTNVLLAVDPSIDAVMANPEKRDRVNVTKDIQATRVNIQSAYRSKYQWKNGTTLEKIGVDSVTLNKDSESIVVGGTSTLTATVTGSTGINEDVVWTIDNDAVADVDQNGVVTGIAAGTARITVTSVADSSKTATCDVTVTVPPVYKVYKRVTSFTAGRNYLIVDRSGDGHCHVLKHNTNGTLDVYDADIVNGEILFNEPGSVWTVGGNPDSSFTLSNDGAYLACNDANPHVQAEPNNWVWNGRDLADGPEGKSSLRYSNGGFTTIYIENSSGVPVHLFEEAPMFTGYQLVLTGQLGLIFKMDLSCLTDAELASGKMSFSINGGDPVEVTGTAEGNGKYAFTCEVNSLQMADSITATYSYGAGKSVSDTYTVKQYLDYIIGSSEERLAPYQGLAKAIEDYGHYAQQYLKTVHDFTLGTDYTAMAPFNDTLTPLTAEQLAPLKPSFTASAGNVSGLAVKLSLDSETALRIRPIVSDGSAVTGTVSFPDRTPIDFQNGSAVIGNIKAAQLAMPASISCSVGEGTLTGSVSALSFVYVVLKDASSSEELKNLAIALYNYYDQIPKN